MVVYIGATRPIRLNDPCSGAKNVGGRYCYLLWQLVDVTYLSPVDTVGCCKFLTNLLVHVPGLRLDVSSLYATLLHSPQCCILHSVALSTMNAGMCVIITEQ